ncbi:MAG: TadE family protein [Candidatus Dormibacteria bacterium]
MSRAVRRPTSGQAMIEFAMTMPIFLLVFFGIIGAALYGWQRSTAVGASAIGVRIAAGGTARNGCLECLAVNDQSRLAAENRVASIIRPNMFGSKVEVQGGRDCSGDTVPVGIVEVCAFNASDPDAATADPDADDTVTVRVRGRLAMLLPAAGFNPGVAIDIHQTIHRLTFSK